MAVFPEVRARSSAPLIALLADRDADSRSMYAEYLRRSAYRVEETDDGRDALARAITIQPDVVVAETRLPGINGYELCRLLRHDPATRRAAIVMVTTDALSPDLRRAETAGADAVLVKPCLPETLRTEIDRLTRQSSDLRERSRATRARLQDQIARSEVLIERSRTGRTRLSSSHDRRETTEPPLPPPTLVCPACDQPLRYVRSHIGGVSAQHSEQWDYFECQAACGAFQYRQRTRKLRRV